MRHKFPLLSIASLTVFCTLSPAAHAKPGKPCDLLSLPAAETLFGAPLKSTLESMGMVCVYSNAERSAVNINFQMVPDGAPATYGTTIMKAIPHKDYQTDVTDSVPGLGDQNFFITDKEIPKSTLTVLYHNAIVSLIVTGSKNANLRAVMIQTMKQALTKF